MPINHEIMSDMPSQDSDEPNSDAKDFELMTAEANLAGKCKGCGSGGTKGGGPGGNCGGSCKGCKK